MSFDLFKRHGVSLTPGQTLSLALICAVFVLLQAGPGLARIVPEAPTTTHQTASICDRAAGQIAAETEVPLDVLRGLTRTETGRKQDGEVRPWPWTINMEGKGLWFDTREEAVAYAQKSFDRGARSFDMGCFQVNYKWHGQHFTSLDEMMDPLMSARYAARFLKELYSETGDWPKAVGFYHSRTPKYYKKYLARYTRLVAKLPPMPDAADPLRNPLPASPKPVASTVSFEVASLPRTAGAVQLTQRKVSGGLLIQARPLFE